jgi:sulfotransferase family protein
MTVTRPAPAADSGAVAGRDGLARNAPVVVLTYGQAGGQRLRTLLGAHHELACTTGTGILAACDQAAVAWREADARPGGPLSSLGARSIRQLAATMITVVTARTGSPRWCETAMADRSAAETFLQLFPAATFVCLHRACPDVVTAVLRASPWGPSGPALAPYLGAYPASTAAALSAWWASRAGPLLDFEKDHPQACLRMRFEDLTDDEDGAMQRLRLFLGLTTGAMVSPHLRDDAGEAGPVAGAPATPPFPVSQLPGGLVTSINDLHRQLGYQPLPARP